jgi:NADH dehydrogenase
MQPRDRQIVIVGGGFGGIQAAKALSGSSVSIKIIDRSNHHLFQPLLYQVATAGLSPADIAVPIREVFRRKRNVEVLMAEVTGVDPKLKHVLLAAGPPISYDYLVLATGARHGYFSRPDWERFAPGLKTIMDATAIRRRILTAFERGA